jgi:hypothetical protein
MRKFIRLAVLSAGFIVVYLFMYNTSDDGVLGRIHPADRLAREARSAFAADADNDQDQVHIARLQLPLDQMTDVKDRRLHIIAVWNEIQIPYRLFIS